MSDKIKKRLWEKELSELNQYNWLTAMCNHPIHRDCVSDIRVANVIMQHTNKDGFAYPSQQTIAQLSGPTSTRQVSKSISRMRKSGALRVLKISSLSDYEREKLGGRDFRRNNRGVVYELCLFWAWETLEAHGHIVLNDKRRPEPKHLQKARQHRTLNVPQHQTMNVVSLQDNECPTNSQGNALIDTHSGLGRVKNRERLEADEERLVPVNPTDGGVGAVSSLAKSLRMPRELTSPDETAGNSQLSEYLNFVNQLEPGVCPFKHMRRAG